MATVEETVFPIDPVTEPTAVESLDKVEPSKSAAAPKEAKTKKVPVPKKRTSPGHPPYFEMIKEAIDTLKDRTGSSQYAIAKFIEDNHKALPSNFRKVLLLQLKKLVANEKLVKVKSSFKLPSARSAKPASAAPVKNKKLVSVTKAKPKAAASTKAKKAADVAKPKPKANTAAVKPKAVAGKAKAAVKAKPVVKAKAAAPKRKAPEKSKAEKKPVAKVAKTGTRSTPRKAAALKKKTTVALVRKTPAKSVKPKSIKSPAKKKAVTKRGKK